MLKSFVNFYDRVDSHIRSLLTAGIPQENYGPLLIPIILEKLPDDIKLELGSWKPINWKLTDSQRYWKKK